MGKGEALRIDQALEHHRAGRLDQAAALYRRILQARPTHFDALRLLGAIAYQRGDDAEAVELASKAIAADHGQPTVFNLLGLALLRQGKLGEAEACFARALTIDPRFATAHNNLGTALRRQGRLDEAIDWHRRALALDPKLERAQFNLGQALAVRGDLEAAAESFGRAAATDPDPADALVRLADMLEALGRGGDAISRLEEALGRDPDRAVLHGRLADTLHAQGSLPRAIGAYRHAVALDPTLAGAWWGLGCALASLGDHAAAAESLRQVVAIQPDLGMARHNLGKSLFELGQVDAALDAFRESVRFLPSESRCEALGNIAVMIPGSPTAQNQDILEARRAWGAQCVLPFAVDKVVAGARRGPGQPLRLGYVSAFFAKPNWMKPVWGLVNHHNRDPFEVHLFSDGPESSIRDGYRKDPRDRFHDIAGYANADLARLIEDSEIDVLVDLNAYSRLARLPLFALRPAPVQVTWFNMFATSGLDCFDYLVGDEYVIPPAEEVFYTERVVRVPGCYLTFEVDYPVPEVVPAPCLKRGGLTFGCLAPQYKITTEVVEAWSSILMESADSRLILKNVVLGKPAGRDFVRALFERFSVSADRVDLDGPAEHFTFLERYNDIDIALDTFPYNGGTTTMEALWQGVPVLTFSGDRWASRISASLLHNAGLPDFVAPDLDQYVARAVALANSADTPARIDALRRTMRDRLRAAPVCDVHTFAHNLEEEYLRMWRRRAQAP